MNKKQLKNRVSELYLSGKKRSEIFEELSDQTIKKDQLAFAIASDQILTYLHSGKVSILVTIMLLLALFGFFLGFYTGMQIGSTMGWFFGSLMAFIMLLFAWGFHNHKVSAYNIYILLTIIQLPNALKGILVNPVASSIGIGINLSLLVYVWYVREKLFPGFTLMTPKKVNGQYVFAN